MTRTICSALAGPRAGLLLLAALAAGLTAQAPVSAAGVPGSNCRWATSVVGFSSQYSTTAWSAQHALGSPDTYSSYGDIPSAWASATSDGQREFLVLAYSDPAPINFVNVYETWNPGAIDRIAVKNPGTGLFETVWTGTAAAAAPVSRVFTATFPQTSFDVTEVRIEFNSPVVPNWNEVDAVAIGLCDYAAESHWVASVTGFSSEYNPVFWSAQQTIGPPNTPLGSADYTAWASAGPDNQREFLVLAYDTPTVINFVSVYETIAPGAVDSVSVKNPGTGLFETVWTGTAAPAGPARIFTVSFPVTQFPVSEVRLGINSPAVPGWNEIDAVGIGRCVCSDRLVDAPPAPAPAGMLGAPRPNPFRGSTELAYSLRAQGHVRIEVFNTLGQRVTRLVDRALPAGPHVVQWNGRDGGGRAVSNGIYYVRVVGDGSQQTRRVVKID